ncbi:MAG: DNA polymerase IV [Methanonatronarchaeales archaeon]|nr:DNA polymerase IV [Methanonatronarchaeales archaeon]
MRLSESGDDRVVVHVDLDCFYAACERLREPRLRGEPVVVGMGYDAEDPWGAVATASYEAREFGVGSAMPIGRALELLPRMEDADPDDPSAPGPEDAGHYRPVDMALYKKVSAEARGLLRELADVFEPVSIDEAYLDMSETVDWSRDEPREFARRLKSAVEDEIGLTASVGVAPTKSAAKVASDLEKPDGLVVVEPGEVAEFFAPLDVEEIHGVGPVTADRLRDTGIDTAGDLASADPQSLAAAFGSRGREMHLRTRGIDPREVSPPEDPKSLSKEKSISPPTDDPDVKEERVQDLAGLVAQRARERGALYRTVGVKVVEPPFDVRTRERTLPGPVDDPELLEEVALDLLGEFRDAEVRKLGVRVSSLSFTDGDQSSLDEWEGGDGDPFGTERRRAGRDPQRRLEEFASEK